MTAATMTNSDFSGTYIKNEPNDGQFDPNMFVKHQNGLDYTHPQFNSWGMHAHGAVDPLDLNMTTSPLQNAHAHQHGATPFMGSSAVTDDDLLDSFGGNTAPMQMQGMQQRPPAFPISVPRPQFNYSHTPDGPPIRSPFINGFDYGNWQPQTPHMPAPVARSLSGQGVSVHDRTGASSRGSGSGAHSSANTSIQTSTPMHIHRHSSSTTHWDSSIGSGFDSPLSSPGTAPVHPQISEVLRGGTPSSPSTTTPSGQSAPAHSHAHSHAQAQAHSHPKPASSADMKKAKRRASHNEVERRRRNHINDQISALSRLVPQHRLDDDIIRRAMSTNSTLPSSITGISPPQATSLLAGGGRRATTGNITQGLPASVPDDRDKSPAKGDVLNGAVSWTQDLLWMMDRMLKREQWYHTVMPDLAPPIPLTDEERRMRSELSLAIERNNVVAVGYSRRDGAGLHVPGFTRHDGAKLDENDEDASPGFAVPPANPSDFFFAGDFAVREGEIKEEDELNMDLND